MSVSRKGIILAGGAGSRLHPITVGLNKQLLPIYDKPMVYYPLSALMLAGIREILVISTPHDIGGFETLLGNGARWGLDLQYCVQPSPDGIAQAYLLAENFLAGQPSALVLGDNVFYGDGFQLLLQNAVSRVDAATVFSYNVGNPEQFGIVEIGPGGKAISLEEKPVAPKASTALTGLYFLDSEAPNIARSVKPSIRGELEIVSVLQEYQKVDRLFVEQLGRGYAWLDTGTYDGLLEAAQFIATLERRQGLKVACLEEIALHSGWISRREVLHSAERMPNSEYGKYLRRLCA